MRVYPCGAFSDALQLRFSSLADVLDSVASRRKFTACNFIWVARDYARNNAKFTPRYGAASRRGFEELGGVGMRWVVKDCIDGSGLNNSSCIHDCDSVAHLGNDA